MKDLFLIALLTLSIHANGQVISTFGGGGTSGIGDNGPATAAYIQNPNGGVFDKYGNYYFVSKNGHRIRKINNVGVISTIAGTGVNGYFGDGAAASSAQISYPEGIALDTSGNLYFCDAGNNRIRKINSLGIISSVAGVGLAGYNGDQISATSAKLNNPIDICLGSDGSVYICDNQNNRIRKIDAAGTISTCAGTGVYGFNGDSQPATAAQLWLPFGLAIDNQDNLYIADWSNKRVRKVNSSGLISTTAGSSSGYLFNGDNIPAINSQIDPIKLTIDKFGNLLICDWLNYRIRQVDKFGVIRTLAGVGTSGFSGDGGMASSAQLSYPSGITVDTCGNLYIAEANNNRIRKVTYPHCGYLEVNPQHAKIDVTIYPNPITDELHVDGLTTSGEYRLVNIVGIIEQTGKLKAGSNSIAVRQLPAGIYLLVLTDRDGNKTITRLIR